MCEEKRDRAKERQWLVDVATNVVYLYLMVGDERSDRLSEIVRRKGETLDEYLSHLQDDLLEWLEDVQHVFPPWGVFMEGLELAESFKDISNILSDIEKKTGAGE